MSAAGGMSTSSAVLPGRFVCAQRDTRSCTHGSNLPRRTLQSQQVRLSRQDRQVCPWLLRVLLAWSFVAIQERWSHRRWADLDADCVSRQRSLASVQIPNGLGATSNVLLQLIRCCLQCLSFPCCPQDLKAPYPIYPCQTPLLLCAAGRAQGATCRQLL